MNKILALYNHLNDIGAKFFVWDMGDTPAATIEIDGRYGVFLDFDNIETTAEELVIVAHEGGHICTGAMHKISSPYDLIEKHEYKADKWAIEHIISAEELDKAMASGRTEIWSLAEYFNVTEDFMRKAICWYTHGNLATDLYF